MNKTVIILVLILIIGLSLAQRMKNDAWLSKQCAKKHQKALDEKRKTQPQTELKGTWLSREGEDCKFKCMFSYAGETEIKGNDSVLTFPDYTPCSTDDYKLLCIKGNCVPFVVVARVDEVHKALMDD